MNAHLILADAERLTAAGTILMSGCVAFVLLLCSFCFWRILRENRTAKQHDAPLDIDVGKGGSRRVRCPNPGCRALNESHAEYCRRCSRPLGNQAETDDS